MTEDPSRPRLWRVLELLAISVTVAVGGYYLYINDFSWHAILLVPLAVACGYMATNLAWDALTMRRHDDDT